MPSGVRDVVRRRIARLPGTLPVARVAAVIGHDVDVDLLTTAAGNGLDGVLDAIEPAVMHRLMAPLPDQPTRSCGSPCAGAEVVADDVSALRGHGSTWRWPTLWTSGPGAWTARPRSWPSTCGRHPARRGPAGGRGAGARGRGGGAAPASRPRAAGRAAARRTAGSKASDIEAELVTSCRLLSIQRSVHGYASVAQSPHLRRAKGWPAAASGSTSWPACCGPSGRPTTACASSTGRTPWPAAP